MIFEGIPFSRIYPSVRGNFRERAMHSVLNLLEKKLGVTICYDARQIPFDRPGLWELLCLAEQLKRSGVITLLTPVPSYEDEPRLALWKAVCGDRNTNLIGGGAWNDDSNALTATLAEALERYIWWEERDHFVAPIRATYDAMQKYAPSLAPNRFSGFSDAQRIKNPAWKFDASNTFLWTRGTSLVTKRPTYVPAQTVSAILDAEISQEPLIRQRTTIGLATWPTQTGARLAGALEIIEREAYMVMWLNQLTLPRISIESLRTLSTSLSEFITACERYRLKIHVIKLLTDAPTHAVCVVIEDESGHAPRFSFGLRAHQSLARAAEKAMTEALRARFGHRRLEDMGKKWDASTPPDKVGHYDRIRYWGVPENAKKLEFLISGEEIDARPAKWENDTSEEYLERIVDWCRKSGYECVSVSLGTSKKNCTPWFIEMMVIPELQAPYLEERFQAFGGERWKSVPQKFDITPREEPYADEPHPFA